MTNIAIVGAGINGLVLAISLRQLGFSPEEICIYEKAELARAEGAGIIFCSEVVSILHQIGIDIKDIGVCLPKLKTFFLKESGKPIIFDIQKDKGQEAYGFLRKHIYNVLLAKVESCGLRVKTGFECLNVVEQRDQCLIHFKDHTDVIADVVIGCDGIYSAVRQCVFPDINPISLNIRAYRGTCVANHDDIARLSLPTQSCYLYCGSNSRVILYPNFIDNKTNTISYYWFAAHRIDANEQAPTNDITANEIETLIKHMPRSPEKLKTLFKETNPQSIIRSSTLRQLTFFECVQGHIALLGDAAHAMAPTAGLGFLLGLINALYLAANLKKHTDNIPVALKQYHKMIEEHAKSCLGYTKRLTELFYIDNPMKTVKQAQTVYAELYALTAASTLASTTFYNKAIQPRDIAATNM